MNNEKIPDIIHESWHEYLQPLFNDDRMKLINHNILPHCKFYPEANNIFRVFSMPLEDIKVVILGQDPYPQPNQAIGLAFAVDKTITKPFSLRIIEKEIAREKFDGNESDMESYRIDRTLQSWHEQGVFLLNTALTVQHGIASSHIKYWQWFTEEVIKIISAEVTPIWMLWGGHAKKYRPTIRGAEILLFNDILEAPHPAAEAYGNLDKFSGCNHFSECNKILEFKKQKQIIW